MTVILAGIGADSENLNPLPPMLNEDGTFNYIPMPEKSRDSSDTTETKTVGDYVDQETHSINYIYHGKWEDKIRDPNDIYNHPVHHDPNFEELTYGDGSRPNNIDQELNANANDIIAFYTGLPHPDDGILDRYIIGYMTVSETTVITQTMTNKEQILSKYPENAHYKRYKGNGDLYAFDGKAGSEMKEEIVIVDGEEPGGLLEKVYPITQREKIETKNGTQTKCKLKPEFLSRFNVINKDQDSRTIDRKPFLQLNIDGSEFIEKVGDI